MGFLGPHGDHLGAVLDASWDRPGAGIAVLGRLGPSWGHLGPSENRCENRSIIRCLERSVFEAILMDFKRLNEPKLVSEIDEKMM